MSPRSISISPSVGGSNLQGNGKLSPGAPMAICETYHQEAPAHSADIYEADLDQDYTSSADEPDELDIEQMSITSGERILLEFDLDSDVDADEDDVDNA